MGTTKPWELGQDEPSPIELQLSELQRKYEAQLAELQQLRDQLAMFTQTLDTIPDLVLIKGPQSRIVYGNRGFRELYGMSQQQLQGLIDAPFNEPDYTEQYVRDDEEVFRTGRTLQIPRERVVRHDGVVRTVETTKAALRDSAGNVAWTVAIIRDLTDKLAAEEAARQSAAQQELIRQQAAMLAELSTPLIPITAEVMVMPLIGTLDAARARQVLETLLVGTAHHRARVVILDITGVPVIDTVVSNMMVTAAKSVRLLGAQVVLTGIRPEVARTLINQQIDLSEVVTRISLQSGISFALSHSSRPSPRDPSAAPGRDRLGGLL